MGKMKNSFFGYHLCYIFLIHILTSTNAAMDVWVISPTALPGVKSIISLCTTRN